MDPQTLATIMTFLDSDEGKEVVKAIKNNKSVEELKNLLNDQQAKKDDIDEKTRHERADSVYNTIKGSTTENIINALVRAAAEGLHGSANIIRNRTGNTIEGFLNSMYRTTPEQEAAWGVDRSMAAAKAAAAKYKRKKDTIAGVLDTVSNAIESPWNDYRTQMQMARQAKSGIEGNMSGLSMQSIMRGQKNTLDQQKYNDSKRGGND